MSFGGLHRTYESKKSKGNNSHFDRLFSKHCKRPAVNHEKSSFQQKKSKYSIFSSKNSLDKSKSPELETGGPNSEVSELISRVPPHPAVVQNFDESLAVDHVLTSGSQSMKDNVPIRPTALVPVAPCKDAKPFSTVLKFRIKNPTRPKNQVVSRIPEHEPVIEKRDIDMLPVTSYPPHDDIIPSDSEVELSEEHAVPSNVPDIHSSTNCNDIEDDDCISRRLPAESTEERIVNSELEESNPKACPSTDESDKFPETVSENIHEKNEINSVCGIVSEDVQEEISGELFDQKLDIMDIDCKINIEEVTDVKKRPIQVSRQLANHVREKPPFFGVNKKKKGISMYKHKFGDRNLNSTTSEKQPSKFDAFDMSISDAKSDEFSFSTHRVEPISVSNRIGAECANTQDSTKPSNPTNESKSHFTVIRNVKHAHQIQDSGEFQEFNDNVDYILDGMGRHNSLFIRCLSTVTLASKCMEPEFRMHLRAHSLVSSFFSEIRDAAYNPSLALCASTVLFVLSQDRLNMDLDRDSLQLMLNLLDTDSRIKDDLRDLGTNKHDLEKNRSKVIELVEKMKEKGHAKTLNSADISAGHLSMEALLSLTSKRAGEWFKEEIRLLGGLEYLTQTFCECAKIVLESAPSALNDGSHDHIATKLMKSARILKVIENVTLDNEENCVYMIQLKDGTFLTNMMQLFKALVDHQTTNFGAETPETNRSTVITECIFDVIRIHINLSHNFDTRRDGSSIGNLLTDSTLLLSLTFTSLFILPQYVAEERRFEIQVISLTLLMNLIEDCAKIRTKVMTETIKLRDGDDCDETSVPDALVNLFNVNKESAIVSESRADDILDDLSNNSPQEKRQKKPEMINEAFDKLLVKAGCHMEHTLLAAYVGMVIGHLIIESKEYEGVFRGKFNDEKSFKDVTDVLMRFYKFMQLTCTSSLSSVRGIQKTQMILKHFETIETNEYEMLNNKEEGVEESMFAFNDSSLCEGDGEGISSHFDSTILHDSSNSNGINKQQEGGSEVTWSSQTIMMNNSVTNSNTADSGTSSSSKFDEL